ncbi:cell wall hydrolase [Cutibacterium avidum]|uniref:cell wall hydrolase n=1 Tax=Cutibacterium avidum TaxID=33010 RepID=UPI00192BD9ED|nr:cell wall hydrolase [Cutibacterium avidum]QQY15397.1 cell wall hydrolase [Cutibacterium avidum]
MFGKTTARLVGSAAALTMALTGAGVAASTVAQAAPAASTSSVPAASLTAEQRQNAYTIIRVAEESNAIDPAGKDNAIHAAIMAAMQESSLRNLNYGDRDSVGLFQQRPSTGWGSVEQIMDPVFAAQSFYGINDAVSNPGVIQKRGWQTMDPGQLAQAVQVSAYPDRYAQWYPLAEQLLKDYRAGR